MHNLGTVINFEVMRSLKKKSFWIMALFFPIMMAAVFGIVFASNNATSEAAKDLEKQKFSIELTDDSGMLSPRLISSVDAKVITDKQQGIDDVKNGKVDAYFYYPKNLTTHSVQVYGKEDSLFNNGKYSSVATSLLTTSVNERVDEQSRAVISSSVTTDSTYYRNGKVYDGVKEMILPGVFLILFYLLISFFGNQMLVSTTEEKENRVIEMILTTIEARTLIVGKIISLIILACIQGLLIITPALIGYLIFHGKLNLPFLDLSTLIVNWGRIGMAIALFAASFMMFTGLLVAIGSAVPTAKEAGQFFGIIMMLIFGPLYAVTLFISAPDSPLVRFLTLFPLTAPIPLMLRNALGNLDYPEAWLGLLIVSVTAIVVTAAAVRIFRYGALQYSRKVSLSEILGKK